MRCDLGEPELTRSTNFLVCLNGFNIIYCNSILYFEIVGTTSLEIKANSCTCRHSHIIKMALFTIGRQNKARFVFTFMPLTQTCLGSVNTICLNKRINTNYRYKFVYLSIFFVLRITRIYLLYHYILLYLSIIYLSFIYHLT